MCQQTLIAGGIHQNTLVTKLCESVQVLVCPMFGIDWYNISVKVVASFNNVTLEVGKCNRGNRLTFPVLYGHIVSTMTQPTCHAYKT